MRFFTVALLALTAGRLVLAAVTPLSPDEAYYWIWSHALAWGFYDHPPMVALWIRAGTYLCGDTALGVRLLAPLSMMLASIALAHAGAVLTGDRARGVMAAVLLNATLAFGIGAVSMTPDTPLLFFWILGIAALARFLTSGNGAWFLAVGVCVGLALASKYTALFLGAAVLVWLLTVPSLRVYLRWPWPWLGALIALVIFAPVILWNAKHDWASFIKQGGRVAEFRPDNALFNLLEFIAGQIIMLTPLIFTLFCAGTVVAMRHFRQTRDPALALLLLLSLLPLPVLLEHMLADRVQANWPVILYPSAMLLAVMAWPRLHRPAVLLGLALITPVYLHATWPVLPIPPKLDPSMKRLAGWAAFAADLDTTRRATGGSFIAADNYATAAILAWHLPRDVVILGAHPRWAYFTLPHPDLIDQSGLLVRSTRVAEPPDPAPWGTLAAYTTAERQRAGIVAETYRLYRVTASAPNSRLVTLPRP
ncbi:MAG: glycosyltransferase family 39 protein [Acetobacteraceae bacterium]|nr:glycosyltransferase family 39 protein [Acetobacteraceae bacterium]